MKEGTLRGCSDLVAVCRVPEFVVPLDAGGTSEPSVAAGLPGHLRRHWPRSSSWQCLAVPRIGRRRGIAQTGIATGAAFSSHEVARALVVWVGSPPNVSVPRPTSIFFQPSLPSLRPLPVPRLAGARVRVVRLLVAKLGSVAPWNQLQTPSRSFHLSRQSRQRG